MPIRPAELIERKRDGGRLAPDEITELVLGHARGEIPDYQLAAFCMAVYFRGLTAEETLALTDAFVRSGSTLDLKSELGRSVVDKHSTGGVGDKTSIVVGPLVAACGVPFGKMSGRGLGHTGGTLDKLESIPGFRVELSNEEFVEQVRDVGLAIIGQSPDLVPADKRLYALRDVTATVDSIPLIAASIMSKKIAAGAEAIVLDVKVGDGAFMKSLEDARMLAEAMLELGRGADRNVVALLTDMDQPLGWAIGNAIEIEEARTLLSGGDSPPDLFSLAVQASGRLLSLSDLGIDAEEGAKRAEAAIDDGSALDAYERWITAQGGDPSVDVLPRAPVTNELTADREGFVGKVSALGLGRVALDLGAGRRTKEDADRPRSRHSLLRQARGRGPTRSGPGRGLCARRRLSHARPRRDPGPDRDRGRAAAAEADRPRDPGVTAPRRRYAPGMPELPEVETIRIGLEPHLVGRTFEEVEIEDPRLTRPYDPREVAAELTGEKVESLERRGKYLVVRFETGRVLLIHLRMTGSLLLLRDAAAADDPHRRAVVRLDNGSDVAYRDVRRFGTWLLLEPGRARALPRGAHRLRAARPVAFGTLARRPNRPPPRASEGARPRPAALRRCREHLRRRGSLVGAPPSPAARQRADPGRARRPRAVASGGRFGAESSARVPPSATTALPTDARARCRPSSASTAAKASRVPAAATRSRRRASPGGARGTAPAASTSRAERKLPSRAGVYPLDRVSPAERPGDRSPALAVAENATTL